MAQHRLSAEQQVFIVVGLAQYLTYSQIVREFVARFPNASPITPGTIQHYDPRYEPLPAKRWVELHEQERKRFNDDLAAQPMESRAWRQRARWRAAIRSAEQGNFGLLGELIADGSREATGGFGKRRVVSGPDGGPIETRSTVDLSELSTDLLRRLHDEIKGE